jgi:hypothetical protein
LLLVICCTVTAVVFSPRVPRRSPSASFGFTPIHRRAGIGDAFSGGYAVGVTCSQALP